MKMKMKFFETVQENMATLGFHPNQRQGDPWKLSSGQIFGVCMYSVNIVLIGGSVWEANGCVKFFQ